MYSRGASTSFGILDSRSPAIASARCTDDFSIVSQRSTVERSFGLTPYTQADRRSKQREAFMLEPSAPFPNFSLPNQDGKFVSLKDFKGKWLVIYVYPKDDTPGCTIQG